MTRPKTRGDGMGWFWALFAFCALLSLALFGGVVFVVIHFLSKVW